jgi:hypothetical protein
MRNICFRCVTTGEIYMLSVWSLEVVFLILVLVVLFYFKERKLIVVTKNLNFFLGTKNNGILPHYNPIRMFFIE